MKVFSTPLPFYAADAGAGADAGADQNATTTPQKEPPADPGAGAGDQTDPGAAGGSFLAGADDASKDSDKKVVAPADWPDDWRDKMGAGDKEALKTLERYKSPADVAKALREAQKKIGAGRTLSDEPMPDAEKEPEAAKEWRKARGIPDDPTGYEVPDAVKSLVKDEDKPRLAEFTEFMHKKGVPASAAGAAMEWYFQTEAEGAAAIAEADKADATEVEDTLRAEWGSDFRANATVAKRFAEEITPGINWFEARLPDGRTLGNVPEFVKALAELGTREYGDVAFAGGEATNKTLARKEEIERMMRDDIDAYRANPKLAQEYEAIVDAELKRNARQR